MEKILLSACLLGQAVRYDGGHKQIDDGILQRWLSEGRVVSLCPELAGGLSVPRPAAEIASGGTAADVLAMLAMVITAQGNDASLAYVHGAQQAAALAKHDIRVAVLKDGSPSCGSSQVYDGSFNGKRIGGEGVTAALLRQMGVQVFSEQELAQADACLNSQRC